MNSGSQRNGQNEVRGACSGEYDLCICVLVYNKISADCRTIASLQRNLHLFSSVRTKLVIWNNGPASFRSHSMIDLWGNLSERVDIELCETLGNSPLSTVYNSILERANFRRLCILDDDSDPDELYLSALCEHDDVDLIVPKIVAASAQHGPRILGKLMVEGRHLIERPCGFFSIGSGLAASRELLDRIKSAYGDAFDRRFAFYGVDTSFCMRIERLARIQAIEVRCEGTIEHELSRLAPGSRRSHFRRSERGWDLGITLRHYPELRLLKPLVGTLLRGPFGGVSVLSMIRGYVRGAHPRAIADCIWEMHEGVRDE